MEYSVGSPGRVIMARLDNGEEIRTSIETIVRQESIRSGIVYILGAVDNATIVAGPSHKSLPPLPCWIHLEEPRELLGIGTIVWDDKAPSLHLHASFGRNDQTHTGCLRHSGDSFITVEVVIMEITGISASRSKEPKMGVDILRLV